MTYRRAGGFAAGHRRGAALYMLVIGCCSMVSLLGLASLTLARVRARGGDAASDLIAARWNARAAAHLAMSRLAADSSWRSNFGNGVLSAPISLNTAGGTLSWSIRDSDGSLSDLDQLLSVTGVGRSGVAVQSLAVQIRASQQVGPQVLRSMVDSTSLSTDQVRDDKRWCQYLKPTLPSNARWWWVTSVSLGCRRMQNNVTFQIQTSEPVGGKPSGNVYQSSSVNSSILTTSWVLNNFPFTTYTPLPAGAGICVAITTTSTQSPIQVAYRGGGMLVADSALVRGNRTAWNHPETDKALYYEVHGVYSADLPDPTAIAGTWTWEAAP